MKGWNGVIIQDGLKDMSVLDHVGIIEKRSKELGISGRWTVVEVFVEPDAFEKVVKKLKAGLMPAWYSVFNRGSRQVIVFKDKVFNIKKGSKRSLTEVKNWAFKKYNIMPEVFTLDF